MALHEDPESWFSNYTLCIPTSRSMTLNKHNYVNIVWFFLRHYLTTAKIPTINHDLKILVGNGWSHDCAAHITELCYQCDYQVDFLYSNQLTNHRKWKLACSHDQNPYNSFSKDLVLFVACCLLNGYMLVSDWFIPVPGEPYWILCRHDALFLTFISLV